MHRALRRRARLGLRAFGIVCIAALAIAGVAGASASSNARGTGADTRITGGTATMALPPGQPPTYIFPLLGVAYQTYVNIAYFQYLLYRPLYSFGKGGKPVLDESLSLAAPPTFKNGNRTVVLNLKRYNWSDGKPVTTRDVAFWMNLLKANRDKWAPYVKGYFPDNVKSIKINSPTQMTFTLDRAYSARWFTYNQLSQITPIPQHAWDRTSVNGKVGNYDTTVKGGKAVYAFLDAQSKKLASYASNPLWKVVDGPWLLTGLTSDGLTAFKPNPRYSGPTKPSISKFVLKPFTSEPSEFNVLVSSKDVDYGYLPINEASQASRLEQQGYTVEPWIGWGVDFVTLNNNNPTLGALFKQTYLRQAMQHLIDQPSYVKNALKGNGYPTYGPVPVTPSNPFVSSVVKANPLPYDPSAAVALLKAHGWTVKPNGTSTCAKPGAGADSCGEGVTAGMEAKFSLQYTAGLPYLDIEMQALKSSFSQAGIDIELRQVPINTLYGTLVPCTPSQSVCDWQMGESGGWGFGPDYYPAGDIFATGSGTNFGSYSDKTNDANIQANHTALTDAAATAAITRFQNYLAKQSPVLWFPKPYYQISAINTKLKGVLQRPMTFITPETWYFVK